MTMDKKVLVIGEALIDVVHGLNGEVKNIPGGSPANTAVALSRLGIETFMKARSSNDDFGVAIKNYLSSQDVNIRFSISVDEPSSVIKAVIQNDGSMLGSCFNASVLALLDAGIYMNSMPIAVTFLVQNSNFSSNSRFLFF